jgi:serine/tyrosine/threonine adenylyltransferase
VLPGDTDQANALMKLLAAERVDWTIFWRRFSSFSMQGANEALRDLFIDRAAFDAWASRFKAHLAQSHREVSPAIAQAANPALVLRNHLAQQAIAAAQMKDFSVLARLHVGLSKPFEDNPVFADLSAPPPDWAQHIEVSCSS